MKLISPLIILSLSLTALVACIQGIIMAFKTHVLIGVAFIFLPPLGTITAIADWTADIHIPQEIVRLVPALQETQTPIKATDGQLTD